MTRRRIVICLAAALLGMAPVPARANEFVKPGDTISLEFPIENADLAQATARGVVMTPTFEEVSPAELSNHLSIDHQGSVLGPLDIEFGAAQTKTFKVKIIVGSGVTTAGTFKVRARLSEASEDRVLLPDPESLDTTVSFTIDRGEGDEVRPVDQNRRTLADGFDSGGIRPIPSAKDPGSGLASVGVTGPGINHTCTVPPGETANEVLCGGLPPFQEGSYSFESVDRAGNRRTFALAAGPPQSPRMAFDLTDSLGTAHGGFSLLGLADVLAGTPIVRVFVPGVGCGNIELVRKVCQQISGPGECGCVDDRVERVRKYGKGAKSAAYSVANVTDDPLFNLNVELELFGTAVPRVAVDFPPIPPDNYNFRPRESAGGGISFPEIGLKEEQFSSDNRFRVLSPIYNFTLNLLLDAAAALAEAAARGLVAAGKIYFFGGSLLLFVEPAELELTLTPAEASGVDLASLTIHRYNGQVWERSLLSGQSVTQNPDGSVTVKAKTTASGTFGAFYDLPDALPPRTTAAIGQPKVAGADRTFITSGTLIGFTAEDDAQVVGDKLGRGAATTFFSIDDPEPANFLAFNASFTIVQPGSHVLSFYSVDVRGSSEAIKTALVEVDQSAPPAPVNLLAGGSSPSPWSNGSFYTLSWSAPSEPSGIARSFIRVGSGEPIVTGAAQAFTVSLGAAPSQGATPAKVWLEDGLGNASEGNAATVSLRFDDAAPVSQAASPAAVSTGPIMVAFAAADPGAPATGSGVAAVALWSRKLDGDISCSSTPGAWQASASSAAAAGQFAFSPSLGEGTYCFFTQAQDAAGNAEPAPQPGTPAKAATLFDQSAPVISNLRVVDISSAQATVKWTTDDLTTGVVDYGLNTGFGSVAATSLGRTHAALLDCSLLSPDEVFFRVKALNRTGFGTQSEPRSFQTAISVSVPETDGFIDLSKPIVISVNNPELLAGSFTIGGQQGSFNLAAGTTFAVFVDPDQAGFGEKTLELSFNGFSSKTDFIVDPATRSHRLVRHVADEGGGCVSNGESILCASFGQMAAGPAVANEDGTLYTGYFAAIDPVAPGPISSFTVRPGPGKGELTASWDAPGDDAGVGSAMNYELRFKEGPLAGFDFAAANIAAAPIPADAPTRQEAVIRGLSTGTLFTVGLQAFDELSSSNAVVAAEARTFFEQASAQSTPQGEPVLELFTPLNTVTIETVPTASTDTQVALAVSAVEAQQQVLYSQVFDIGPAGTVFDSPATINFRYTDPGDPVIESHLAVFHFTGGQWVELPLLARDLENNLLTASVASLSLFAVLAPDDAPPETALVFTGGRQFVTPEGAVFGSTETTLSFSVRDPPVGASSGSGVAFTEYRFNDLLASFTQTDAAPILVPVIGENTLRFRSFDVAGNTEPVRSAAVAIDAAGPVAVLSSPERFELLRNGIAILSTSAVAGGLAELRVELLDPLVPGGAPGSGSGVAAASMSLNGADFAFTPSSFSLNLSSGLHFLALLAEDKLNNRLDLGERPLAVVVGDARPPRTSIVVGEPSLAGPPAGGTLPPGGGSHPPVFISRATPLILSALDDQAAAGDGTGFGVAAIEVSVDGAARERFVNAAPSPGEAFISSFTLSADTDGVKTISFMAEDALGLREAAKAVKLALDASGPETSLLVLGGAQAAGLAPGSFYASSATRYAFSAVDPAVNGVSAGVEATLFRYTTGAFESFSSTFTLAESLYHLEYQSRDRVKNLEVLRGTRVLVDASAPRTELVLGQPSFLSPEGADYVSPATELSLSASDPGLPPDGAAPGSGVERIELSTTGTGFSLYAGSFTVAEGIRLAGYRSTDRVGNAAPAVFRELRSDGTAPVSRLAIGAPQALLADGALLVSARTGFGIVSEDPAVEGVSSGVRERLFRVPASSSDASAFEHFSASFTLGGGDAIKKIEFFARDNVNNAELLKSSAVLLDATPPKLALLCPAGSAQGICRVFQGVFPVLGAVSDPHLAGFTLDFATSAESAFLLISSGTAELSGELGSWDTAGLSGFQTLRLSAADLVGNFSVSTATVFVGKPGRSLVLGGGKTFKAPAGVASGPEGRIYAADAGHGRVAVFSPQGALLAAFGGFKEPRGVAVDEEGNLFVADAGEHRVAKLSPAGETLLELGRFSAKKGKKEFKSGKKPGEFKNPAGVAVGANGDIYVSDAGNRRVQKFSGTGGFLVEIPLPPAPVGLEEDDDEEDDLRRGKPDGIAVDAAGNIYVADQEGRRALKFGINGELLLTIGRYGDGLGEFLRPSGLAVSPGGDCIVVADREVNRIQKFGPRGHLLLSFGEKGEFLEKKPLPQELVLKRPLGLALDGQGRLLAADAGNDRLQRFGLPGEEMIVAAGGGLGVGGAEELDSAAGADASFAPRGAYVYPNPAVGGAAPVLHAAVGIADQVVFRVYDVAGELAHQTALTGTPAVIDDGSGAKYAYEYAWRGNIPSGVYLWVMQATKAGHAAIVERGKLAVVR